MESEGDAERERPMERERLMERDREREAGETERDWTKGEGGLSARK